jgi:beta-glucosidase-like glycosyl hydrolase/V8-like Glu-specific endopeptidase
MRAIGSGLVGLLAFLWCGLTFLPQSSWKAVRETNQRAIVFLSVTIHHDNGVIEEITGTGFLVDSNGWILTCAHVVPSLSGNSAPTEYLASVGGRREHQYPFHVVRRDAELDLALLKLDQRTEPWPTVKVDLDARLDFAQTIYVMGYPLAGELDGVSGTLRSQAGARWITDAPIDKGSSGGPVFSEAGAVIAVAVGAESGGNQLNLIVPARFAAGWFREFREGGVDTRSAVPLEVRPSMAVRPDDVAIEHILQQMDVRALLGQVLMVGFAASKDYDHANGLLAALIRDYGIGSVILYEFNFPDHATAAPDETAAYIAHLTASLRRAAYETQPPDRKIPLLLAIDQEGGTDVRIRRDVTRMPSEIYLGVTRRPELAERVGTAIGKELAALGINVDLAPVADINTKHVTDLIGQRAFSSRPDVAAALSVSLARGLHQGGVLAIAKHYPGHGNTATDPHRALASMGYKTRAELEENDAIPFKAVAQSGVDGIMTSHMLTPLDGDSPATISAKSIRYLRDDFHYDGLVVTDDIVDMMGILMNEEGRIIRDRPTVAVQALRAGHDLILFGCISSKALRQNPTRTVTRSEFDAIYRTLLRHFESDPADQELLRASARRVIRAKARVAPLNGTLEQWIPPFDPVRFRALVTENTTLAREVAQASAILVTEHGRVIGDITQAAYFRKDVGPLSRGEFLRDDDRVLLVSPVTTPPDELYEALISRWIPADRIDHYPLVYGWTDESSRQRAAKLWKRTVPIYSHVSSITGQTQYFMEAIDPEVERIVAAAKKARVIVFGALKHEQLRILERVCRRLNDLDHEIIILLFREPYFLSSAIYEQHNVTVLNLSAWPTTAVASDFLFGELRPLPATALSVAVPEVVDRPAGFTRVPSLSDQAPGHP